MIELSACPCELLQVPRRHVQQPTSSCQVHTAAIRIRKASLTILHREGVQQDGVLDLHYCAVTVQAAEGPTA